MERRFAARRDQLLANVEVDPRIPRGVLPRLQRFLDPFVDALQRSEQTLHAHTYVAGLLSDLKYKNVESIAYLHDQEREPLQQFIGQSPLGTTPSGLTHLARQVGQQLDAQPGWGSRLSTPSAFPKKRQRFGRGPTAMVRSSRQDRQLSGRHLPGLRRPQRARPGGCPPVPAQGVGHGQAAAYPGRHPTRRPLPHAARTDPGDAGRAWPAAAPRVDFRRRRGGPLFLVSPGIAHRATSKAICWQSLSNTSVRDLTAPEPAVRWSRSVGRPCSFTRVDRWCKLPCPETAWQTIEVRAGEKGPVVVQVVRTLVQARTEGRASAVAELLVVFRERQGDGTWKHDYLLSAAPLSTPLAEFARVFKAQHRVEECLQRAKGEAGLADYEVRTWRGWYHHQALALTATWFLTVEAGRGKKMDAGVDGVAVTGIDSRGVAAAAGYRTLGVHESHFRELAVTPN